MARWLALKQRYGQGESEPWSEMKNDDDCRARDEVMRRIHEFADQGNSKTQFNLGNMYFHGQGVPKDNSAAVKWLGKAAVQGHIEAQASLAGMYFHGLGVDQRHATAMKWYRKASEQGHAMALTSVACM